MTHVLLPIAVAPPEIPGWLIQALLVFFFIVLPILRSIRETIAKRKELAERRSGGAPAGEADAAPSMDEARRRWEALLRGEETAAPVPPPVPVPVPAARPAPVQPGEMGSLSGRLSDLRPAPTEDEVEAANDETTADPEHFIPDEETRAREENERRLREEREARSSFLQRERETGAGRRANVTSDPMTSLGAPTAAARIERNVRPAVLFADGDSQATRRAALRRAFVAAEVMGPPAALRDPASGPPGLRRSA